MLNTCFLGTWGFGNKLINLQSQLLFFSSAWILRTLFPAQNANLPSSICNWLKFVCRNSLPTFLRPTMKWKTGDVFNSPEQNGFLDPLCFWQDVQGLQPSLQLQVNWPPTMFHFCVIISSGSVSWTLHWWTPASWRKPFFDSCGTDTVVK